jgi:hypothetical protein
MTTPMERFNMIDQLIGDLSMRVRGLEQRVIRLEGSLRGPAPGLAPASVLDGPHGDPVVHRDPRDWCGTSQVGKKFSECPPDYLDMLAGMFDWFAKRDRETGRKDAKGRETWPLKEKDASMARGWAARIRANWNGLFPHQQDGVRQVEKDLQEVAEEFDEEDIPF